MPNDSPTHWRLAWAMACAAVAGFVSLSWEILWLRVYAFGSGTMLSHFGLFLGVYLAGIAAGTFLARHACATGTAFRPERIRRTAGLTTAAAAAVAYLHTPVAAWVAGYGSPMPALVLAGFAGGLYGAILPLVTHCAVPAGAQAGRRVSYVYLANICGSALGSSLTGFVFLEALGMALTSAALLVTSTALAAVLICGNGAWRTNGRLAAIAAMATLAPLPLSDWLYGSLYERLLWKHPSAAEYPFAHLIENRTGVVAVTSQGTVFGSGVYDGRVNVSLDDGRNMIYRAYAVAALHPTPRNVLVVGLGSGSWAQVVAHLPSVEEVTVVEINPAYIEVVRRYPPVRSLLTNPKVTIVVDDGRRWLAREDSRRFDAIVVNTTFHWRTNTSQLLSREFLALAASRLAPNGILYFNTTDSNQAYRTACASFASGLRFGNFVAVGDGDVVFDVDAFRTTVRTVSVDGVPASEDPVGWLGARLDELLSPKHLERCERIMARTAGVRLITDDNLASETSVPWHAFYRPGAPE